MVLPSAWICCFPGASGADVVNSMNSPLSCMEASGEAHELAVVVGQLHIRQPVFERLGVLPAGQTGQRGVLRAKVWVDCGPCGAGRISACAFASAAASAGVGVEVLVIISLLVVLEVGNFVLKAWGGVNVSTL